LLSFFDRDCRRLKMYEGRNQASFATFVRICATRQALDHLRALRRRPRITADDPRDEREEGRLADAVEPGPGPEEQAQVAERLDRLRTAVARLSAREQLVVRLAFVEGREAPEVASVLGVSDNAVHVLKSRVKSKLKELVGPETLDDE
jgi:RNA polymerase sigma-70 factor (ECF subfamily)